MYPILLDIWPTPIHTYGFLVALGFLAATEVGKWLARREKIDVERVVDLASWSLLVGFLGARILFVLTRWEDFAAHPAEIFKVWRGGLVFLGGPLVVIPFIVSYCKRYRLPLAKILDIFTPGLVLGHAMGRLGCLAAGCCYGKPTGSAFFGIRLYADTVEPHLQGVLLHPTQIYESLALLGLFAFLLRVFRRKSWDGQVALSYLLLYPVIRFVIELFRGDQERGFVIPGVLSTSQFLSLMIFLAGVGWAVWLRQRGMRLEFKKFPGTV